MGCLYGLVVVSVLMRGCLDLTDYPGVWVVTRVVYLLGIRRVVIVKYLISYLGVFLVVLLVLSLYLISCFVSSLVIGSPFVM